MFVSALERDVSVSALERDSLHQAVAEGLARRGQRYSGARRRLIEVLARASRPRTGPEIAAADTALALSSVYRNLIVLEEAQLVRRLLTREDTAKYELAERLTAHHHHLVCDVCADVIDYEAPEALERSLSEGLAGVAGETGFRPRAHALEILGTCAACAAVGGE